ncbi:MAG: NAD-binding protein [Ruminiclostridium sp.]|nr:NAD-binding protein [Ruminiclostridium sp.]
MIICFILAVAVLITTISAVTNLIKRKGKLDTIVFMVALSCFLQMLLLTIGLADTDKHNASDILHAIGSSIKAMSGEANTEFVDNFSKTSLLDFIYCEWLYIMWFIAPISAGGVLISTLNKINSLFTKKKIKKEHIFIFTELTPETLITATTKYNSTPSGRERNALFFVFLNGNADLLKGVTIPTLLTTDKLADIRFSDRIVKHIEIWDFCFDGVIRTGEIISFAEKYTSGNYTPKITLNIFDTDSVSEKRYKSLIYKYSKSDDVNIFIYDTYKSSVQSILKNYPIYNFVSDTAETVNIAVIGMGKFGYQFIGNIFGSCHFLNKYGKAVKLCVTAIDSNGKAIRDRYLMESPDFIRTLENEGLLEIISCDAENHGISEILDRKHFDYCVVATNNDETNIRTAKFLKRYLLRKIIHNNAMPDSNEELFRLIPPIIVKIRDGKKSDFIFSDSDDERLIPFGSIETVYNHSNLSTNDIDLISRKLYAINCHSDSSDHEKSFTELTIKFSEHAEKYASKYDIDSTNEEAICLRYLIHGSKHPDKEAMLRYIENPSCIFTSADDDYYFRNENKDELSALVDLLHERWRYFTLYSGFSCPSEEDYKVYEEYNKKLGVSSVHKFVPALYNNLLKPANELSKRSDCDYIKIKLMTYITRP